MEIKLKDIDHDTIILSDESIDNDNFVEVWTETNDGDDNSISEPIMVDIESLYAAVSAFMIKRQERLEKESELEFQESCNNLK